MAISQQWLSIDFGKVIVLLWFWWLPPFVTFEITNWDAWCNDKVNRPSRKLKYEWVWIRVEKYSREEYEKKREKQFPKTPLNRTGLWEGFPGPGWATIIRNKRVTTLRRLNGKLEGIEKSREDYVGARDANNIMLGLLAAVGAAALAVPGIETTHWLARAFWIGSTVLAVCGVLVGGLTPGLFQLFFGDDIEQFYSNGTDGEPDDRRVDKSRMLTLETKPALVHRIDALFGVPTLAITYSGALFIAGAFAFVATVDFASNARSYTRASHAGLIVVAMAPAVLYMANFWSVMVRCSVQHRRFRTDMSEAPAERDNTRHTRRSSSHDMFPRLEMGDGEYVTPHIGDQGLPVQRQV